MGWRYKSPEEYFRVLKLPEYSASSQYFADKKLAKQIDDYLTDFDDLRLQTMDEAGISKYILSHTVGRHDVILIFRVGIAVRNGVEVTACSTYDNVAVVDTITNPNQDVHRHRIEKYFPKSAKSRQQNTC